MCNIRGKLQNFRVGGRLHDLHAVSCTLASDQMGCNGLCALEGIAMGSWRTKIRNMRQHFEKDLRILDL